MEEYAREPCPYRIVDDCGGAFAMGSIGGGLFQAIKGFRNAPSGFNQRAVSHLTINWGDERNCNICLCLVCVWFNSWAV